MIKQWKKTNFSCCNVVQILPVYGFDDSFDPSAKKSNLKLRYNNISKNNKTKQKQRNKTKIIQSNQTRAETTNHFEKKI